MKSLFIMGTGRSGTTVIADLLSQSKEVLNMDETHLLFQRNEFAQLIRKRLIKGMKHNGYTEIVDTISLSIINEMLVIAAKEFLFKFFSHLYQFGYSVILDKTPHNLQETKLINKIYPNSYFIHVIRNPLDVYASMKLRDWGFKNPYAFIEWYRVFMHKSLEQWKDLPSKAVINFEAFVETPRLFIMQIANKLGLEPFTIKGFNLNKVHINRYKNDLSPKEIGLIKDHCMKFYDKWLKLL